MSADVLSTRFPVVSRRTVLGGLAVGSTLGLLGVADSPASAAPYLPGLPGEGQGFLLGMYCTQMSDLGALESTVRRPFDGVVRYRDSNAWTQWPLTEEIPFIERGNVMRYPIESRVFNYANYTPPQGVPEPTWRHSNPVDNKVYAGYRHVDFTRGRLDALLENIASGIKNRPGTFVIDYDHEMDDNRRVLGGKSEQWGVITYNRSAAYTDPHNPDPSEYVAAHRYIVDYLRAAGVQNALFGFCPAGWTLHHNASRLAELYPGNSYVDLIMWDPYNGKGNWRSFSDIVRPMYDAIGGGLFGSGSAAKARFLGEFGCRTGDGRRPGWITNMMTEVKNFPKLRGGFWFSSGSWGAIHGSHGTEQDRAALRSLMASDYVNFKAQNSRGARPRLP